MIWLKNKISEYGFKNLIVITLLAIYLSSASLYGTSFEFEFQSDTSVAYIQLPHQHILKNSLNYSDNNSDHFSLPIKRIDYASGTIVLLESYAFDNKIIIGYEYLPFVIPEYFSKRELNLKADNRQLTIVPPENIKPLKQNEKQASNFRISGLKSIGVSTGNSQAFNLDQILKVQLQGQPVPGLSLTGSISDKTQPVLGGLSSSLEDIETISIIAHSENINIEFGDINYQHNWGDISQLSKRLKGINAHLDLKDVWARGTLAGVKGRYKTVEFFARDGISGPYELQNSAGSRVSLVAGTEHVHLDGRRLKAGASGDYIIDYGLGEITFNPRVVLSSRSRIVVDYEYLDRSYRRNLYSSEIGTNLFNDNLKLSVGYLQLSDSRHNPVDISLSEQDRQVLEKSGDNQNLAVREGAKNVESGTGDYIRKMNESGLIYYQYVGDSLGDYSVRFTRVDHSRGDYRYQGNGIYIYQGKSMGNYLPFEYLPRPSANSALYLNSSGKVSQYLNFDLKLAGSQFDLNSLSSRDDADNQAGWGNFTLNFIPIKNSNKFISLSQTQFALLTRENNFNLPGRTENLELSRKWALGSESIATRSDRLELIQNLSIYDYITLEAELGRYQDKNYVKAKRNGIKLALKPIKILQIDFSRQDRISNYKIDSLSGRMYGDQLQVEIKYAGANLAVGWMDEKDDRVNSFAVLNPIRYDRYFSLFNHKAISLELSHKNQHSLDNKNVDSFKDYILNGRIKKSLLSNHLNSSLELVRREVDYRSDLLPDLTETKLQSHLSFKGFSGLFSGNLSYRLNRQRISRLARNFIKVDQGRGNYRREDSVYVRDPYGDYILIDELLDEGQAGVLSEKSLRLKIDVLKLLALQKKLSHFDLETFLKLEERGGNSYRFNLLYLLPSWRSYPESELFSDFEIRQILSWGTKRGDLFSLGFEERIITDNIRETSGSRYRRLIYEKIYLTLANQFNVRVEHRFKREREQSGYFGSADFGEHDLIIETQYYYGNSFELILSPRYLYDFSKSDNLNITMLGLKISPKWSFSDKGRLVSSVSYYHVSQSFGEFIPYQYAAGNRPGDNYKWEAGINYKYSRTVTLRATYSADKIPNLKVRHRLSLNLRATF